MSALDEVGIILAEETANETRKGVFRRLLSSPFGLIGLVLILFVLIGVLLGPLVYHQGPFTIVGAPLTPPGQLKEAPLGTDKYGRDVLSGLLYGGRGTIFVGLVAAAISSTIGVVIGGLAGYLGKWFDTALMRFTEVFQVMPVLLFAMVLLSLYSPNIVTVALAIGIGSWAPTARLARGEFIRIKGLDYVRSARAVGLSRTRIMVKVVFPNALPPLIVMTSLLVGTAMIFEAGLGFLGLSDSNQASWGLLLGNNRDKFLTAWWPVTFPGLAIFISVLGVSLLGDGLNDALNPRRRG